MTDRPGLLHRLILRWRYRRAERLRDDEVNALREQVQALTTALAESEQQRLSQKSSIDVMEAEIAYQAAWREKEIETLRAEAAIQAYRKIRAETLMSDEGGGE